MISIHPAGYFITGSDTGVGKTYIACELIRQLHGLDVKLETRKPVESGCSIGESGVLIPADALELQAANNNLETIDRIAPYRFKDALAPPRAAALENCHLQLVDLYNACSLDNTSHRLMVEGAGGFLLAAGRKWPECRPGEPVATGGNRRHQRPNWCGQPGPDDNPGSRKSRSGYRGDNNESGERGYRQGHGQQR